MVSAVSARVLTIALHEGIVIADKPAQWETGDLVMLREGWHCSAHYGGPAPTPGAIGTLLYTFPQPAPGGSTYCWAQFGGHRFCVFSESLDWLCASDHFDKENSHEKTTPRTVITAARITRV